MIEAFSSRAKVLFFVCCCCGSGATALDIIRCVEGVRGRKAGSRLVGQFGCVRLSVDDVAEETGNDETAFSCVHAVVRVCPCRVRFVT